MVYKKKKVVKKGGPIVVKIGILGNGTYELCVAAGETTIAEAFHQLNAKLDREGTAPEGGFQPGDTLRMDGRDVEPDDVITKDGALITSTKSVKGGG